jgi:hypothetical protein
MRKNLGNNEASHNGKKKTGMMIVSIIAVTLFIGTALEPALAEPLNPEGLKAPENEEECTLCAPRSTDPVNNPECTSCIQAIKFAVNYSRYHVNQTFANDKEWYPLMVAEVVIAIFEGIHIGLKESGFKISIDDEALKEKIQYWVDRTVDSDYKYNMTEFLAVIGSVFIGVGAYLLTRCSPDDDTERSNTSTLRNIISSIVRRFIYRINAITLLLR